MTRVNAIYVEGRPQGPAAQFVKSYWSCDGYDVPHQQERRLPSIAFQLIIDLAHDRIPPLVVGLPTRYSIIETSSLRSMVGVVFHPGRARAVLSHALDEFAGQELDLDLVWGHFAYELRERLQHAADASKRFELLDQLLPQRAQSAYTPHRALSWTLQELTERPETLSVADLARRAGLSGRRLTQLFQEHVGLTPKTYCRILRLGQVLRHPGVHERAGDWVRVSADCGYYDQSHFAHEFREFSGFTLTEFAARQRPWINHVAID